MMTIFEAYMTQKINVRLPWTDLQLQEDTVLDTENVSIPGPKETSDR